MNPDTDSTLICNADPNLILFKNPSKTPRSGYATLLIEQRADIEIEIYKDPYLSGHELNSYLVIYKHR